MDEYQFFTSTYGKLHEKSWMHPNTYTPIRRIVRKLAAKRLPIYFKNHPYSPINGCHEQGLIASFTSFPTRIEYAYLVVNCMLHQTVIPEKIFLWLSSEQFKDKKSLPSNLLTLENDIFEIRFVDGDLRSHKKYYYVCKEFPDAKVVLLDDDIIYAPTLIERLLTAYNEGDAQIICNYGYTIQWDSNGILLPYRQWKRLRGGGIGNNIFFGSGGGTLFRPSDFDDILTNISLAQRLTPIADDIWLNSIARYSKLMIRMLPNCSFLEIEIKHNQSLYSSNVFENQNDVQISNIIHHFGAENYRFS